MHYISYNMYHVLCYIKFIIYNIRTLHTILYIYHVSYIIHYTAGFPIHCTRTKKLPTNWEGYDKTVTTTEIVSKRHTFLGVEPFFLPFPPTLFSSSSKNGPAKWFYPDFDASFQADSDGGLRFFPSATVCWQINFVY